MIVDTNNDTKYIDGRFYFFNISETERAANLDFSNLSGKEGSRIIKEFVNFYKQNEFVNITGNVIVDLSNSKFTNEIIKALREISRISHKAIIERTKVAIIGSAGMSRVLLNIFSKILKRDIKLFETKDDAIEWIITTD